MQTATPWTAAPQAPAVQVWDVFAFVAELLMVGGLALGGWWAGESTAVSLLLAVALPTAVIVVWSRWCAPRSTHRLAPLSRLALKTVLFGGTFLLLLPTGPQPLGGVLGVAMWLTFLLGVSADRSRGAVKR